MQKIVIVLFASMATMQSPAQTLSPTVLATSGGYSTGGGYSLSYTVGETIVTTLQAGSHLLTQGFQQPEPIVVLPISLVNFTATRTEATIVHLQWHTASENNNKGFDLERRLDNQTEFVKQAFVPSLALNGNSSSLLRYIFKDPNSFSGTSYYRLKQWDYDNRSTYSFIKAVNGLSDASVSLVVFPNPNNGQFKIILKDAGTGVQASITDMSGRLIRRVSLKNDEPVVISNLLPGLYNVTIPDAFGLGRSFSEKVMVGN
jgi:hypothetical protein